MSDKTEQPQQPDPTPVSAETLEQLKADYLALETEAKYVFPEPRR